MSAKTPASAFISPTRYFTGIPCKRGHVCERIISTKTCVSCKHEREKGRVRDCREYLKLHYRKDKAKRIAANREWKRANRDKVRQQEVRSRERDIVGKRLKAAVLVRNRRARKRLVGGRHSPQDIIALFQKQKGICAACPSNLSPKYHVDHILAIARGGSNWPSNLQLLCPPCNQSKGARTMEEWQMIRKVAA